MGFNINVRKSNATAIGTSASRLVEDFDQDATTFSKNYLRTYYSGSIPDPDEQEVLRFCVQNYPKMGRVDNFLELGCGPTIHHLLPAVEYANTFEVAHYLPDCIEEVKLWKEKSNNAHDWSVFTKFVLECEGIDPTLDAIGTRENIVRSKLGNFNHCDLRNPAPLGIARQFPAVGCFYTTEQASMVGEDWSKDQRRDAWLQVMSNLCSVVAPGGWLFMSCVRNSDHYVTYEVGSDTPHRHPLPIVNEDDFSAALKQFGFDLARSEIAGVKFVGQESEGVPGAVLVAALKK